jgi:hypothetical protein
MSTVQRASTTGPAGTTGTTGQSASRRWRVTEHLSVVALGLLVLAVHDVGYVLRQPFWTDEAWVAVTSRFPLAQLPATTSSTPIGWSALAWVFSLAGDQAGRLLTLAFAGAAVMIAYWFARRLGWQRRDASVTAGLLAGMAVLLSPAMLIRDDLKQYTADACAALLTLAVVSRLERDWSRRWLAGLSVTIWGGMLVSHTTAFVGVAAFGALCSVQVARRAWRRLAEASAAGAITAAAMLGVYEGFDARSVVPGLTAYWSAYYPPVSKGLRASTTFVIRHVDAVHGFLGLGPLWLAVPLVIAGLITLARLGRPATAITAAVLWPELLVLAALQKYPFLDLRTSTFLLAVTTVVGAIGLVGLGTLVRPWLKGPITAALIAVAVLAFTAGARPYLRSHLIPAEDVRDQARYVAAHARPADMIVVNLSSNWGFAYYWPIGHPSRRPDGLVLQGYEADFPDQPRIIVARGRNPADVSAALSQALARESGHPCGRIWLIRTHVSAAEQGAWAAALHRSALLNTPIGTDGLSFVAEGGQACR